MRQARLRTSLVFATSIAAISCAMEPELSGEVPEVGLDSLAIEVPSTGSGSPGYTTTQWAVSTDWDGEYDSIEQTVIPQQDAPVDAFYMSMTVYYWGSFINPQPEGYGPMAYMGLQTSPQGKQAIFSLWDATTGWSIGIARKFSGEGTGWQTIIPYAWVAGHTYRFRISRTSEHDPEHGTTWSGYVLDVTTGEEREIGIIRAPHSYGRLKNQIVDFTEYYGAVQRCSRFLNMRPITVAFGRPTADYQTIFYPGYDHYAPAGRVDINNSERPTCAGAAAQRGVINAQGTFSLHRMFGRC